MKEVRVVLWSVRWATGSYLDLTGGQVNIATPMKTCIVLGSTRRVIIDVMETKD